MLGLFMVASALSHVSSIWTIWHAAYWLDGGIKAATAVISLAAAALLVPLLPKTLSPPAASDESERQQRFLAEALPQIVWTADPTGAVDFFNRRWVEYTGMSVEQSCSWGWKPVLHPDDIAMCLREWTNALASGRPYEIEYRFKRSSDGAYRWFLGRALPIKNAAGEIIKWFGTATDIDDLKSAAEAAGRLAEQLRLNDKLEQDLRARQQAEAALRASDELLRQVEEHAPIGLAITSLNGAFLRVNPALCALTGYDRAELLTMQCNALTYPDDLEPTRIYMQQALRGSSAKCEIEKRYYHKDGHIVWILSNVSLVRDENGAPRFFIKQILDISARKVAERTIADAEATALAANRAKSRFLATMSHEIRTPMNGIIGMTELLALSELNSEQRDYVRVVRDSGRSLLRVLNDILDYSKVEAGKLELEMTDFDLLSQVRSVVSLLEPQYQGKDVLLTTQVEPDVPAALEGDPGRLRQILINLLGNALKFTPANGIVRVLVALERSAHDVIVIRFSVIDSGIGIADDVRDRLFVPFSQVDTSTTRKYGGTGLGLSICKQLVELMDGQIGVQSAPGTGSTFWFSLPFSPGSVSERESDPQAGQTGERRAAVRLRSEKLLLAEDNAVNSMLVIGQLKRLGFAATVVVNGREAVAAVQRETFDIVFMDCQMPEMDGLDATRAIRRLPSDLKRSVPIVAMTANAQAEDKEACLAAGMDDYISKPAGLADVRKALARWLPDGVDGTSRD